jgi:hypothetical protein
MSPLVRTLVACGALPKKNTGPAHPMTLEERTRTRKAQNHEAHLRRKERVATAKEQGLPPPVLTRGRPRQFTDEEAQERRRLQVKLGRVAYNERVKDGVDALAKQQSLAECCRTFIG